MYNQNGGTIDKNYSIYLEIGEMISIELENGGIFNNDFTQVTLSAEKKEEFIPDMSQVSKKLGLWLWRSGRSFTEFGASQNYAENSTVKIRKKGNKQYYSASQNTSEIAWTDKRNNITFPPKSKGAIALHPGSGINDYAKVRYTAPQEGEYEIRLIFKHLDTDFSRAKAEIWTNNINNSWYELDEISLTKLLYDDNNGVIERAFTISLKKEKNYPLI